MSQRTILYPSHIEAGARVVDFAGWEMPVQYSGILDEHRAVREAVGIFDISHMGEFFVSGAGAAPWLESLLTNRVANLGIGEGQYSLMLNGGGGVIDDLIVYRTGEQDFFLVVNASKIAEDAAWLTAHLGAREGLVFADRSQEYAAVAVQGPEAPGLFEKLFGLPAPAKNRIIPVPAGDWALAAGTGYTGEEGFELFVPSTVAREWWDRIVAAGAKPCGLGARDTLRLEMCYPLNGSDLGPDRTPLEAGLGFFVDLEKGDFVGRDALIAQKASGLPSRLCALEMEEKGPPARPHYPVWVEGEPVGETTSGALSPSLGTGIAMAYLPAALAKVGQPVEIEIRGRRYRAGIRKKPLYKKS